MSTDAYSRLHTLLTSVPDPRAARGLLHPLADVLFVVLVGVLACADDADAIADFAEDSEAWFRERCGLPHGMPSQDTILRVLASMDPKAFGDAFCTWVEDLWGGNEKSTSRSTERRFDVASNARVA